MRESMTRAQDWRDESACHNVPSPLAGEGQGGGCASVSGVCGFPDDSQHSFES